MTTSIGALITKISRLLSDTTFATHPQAEIYDGIVAAHFAILAFYPNRKVVELTAGSEGNTNTVFLLPTDVYEIQHVQDSETLILFGQSPMSSGTYWGPDTNAQYNDWVVYPDGYITISQEIDDGEKIKLFYFGYWSVPSLPVDGCESDEETPLSIPDMLVAGIAYYATSYCLAAASSASSMIRQFNQRVDSGTPEDNPLASSSKYFYQRFLNEMKLLPAVRKGA